MAVFQKLKGKHVCNQGGKRDKLTSFSMVKYELRVEIKIVK